MKYFTFSGGEVHLQVTDNPMQIRVTDYTMNGFMALAETVEVLKRLGRERIDVVYPYCPYARQDRVMEKIEPFSLKVFAGLLNSLNLSSVEIWDPHSDVAPALINKCHPVSQNILAMKTLPVDMYKTHIFVSPDAGAYKKLSKLIKDDSRIAIGVKKRDDTGNITHTDVFSPVSLENKNCVIVDDICDGGRTFIALALALRARGAKTVQLYVTHGIFSQGIEVLKPHIDHVYTTNSFPHKSTDYLTVKEI